MHSAYFSLFGSFQLFPSLPANIDPCVGSGDAKLIKLTALTLIITGNSTVKPRYLATVRLGLTDGERRGWRLNEGSMNEPVGLSVLLCI